MAQTFKVEGLPELERALTQLGKRIGRKVVTAALRAAVKPMVAAARAKAPKADRVLQKKSAKGKRYTLQPGEGARSIKARVDTKAQYPTVTIGPDANHFYMNFFETGYTVGIRKEDLRAHRRFRRRRADNTQASGHGRHIPATPFLRPAFDAHAAGAIKDFGRIVGRRIEAEAATLANKK